jgi:serine/threonine-protein kinase RsbW
MHVRTSTRFRRETTAVPAARAFVRHALRSAGTSAEDVDTLVLAVAEACNNVVLHARGSDFTVAVTVERGRAVVAVSDSGPGFRPPERPSMPAAHATGHRGLALMNALVGEVVVSSDATGTTVVLAQPLAVPGRCPAATPDRDAVSRSAAEPGR